MKALVHLKASDVLLSEDRVRKVLAEEAAKYALEAYLAKQAAVGEAWVFPATDDPGEPLGKLMASC